jgi:spore coat polysaccharide biosynthesis predicted glycosyltransferase SpsG
MRIVFRADATPQIGAGHVMRLSAIAEEAISRGIDCFFVGEIRDVKWLETYVHDLGFSQILSPESISFVMSTETVLILDSYHIPVDDPSLKEGNWMSIVSISDAQTPDYLADLVVYPNLANVDSFLEDSRILSGPRMIPLRKSMAGSESTEFSANPRILIFGGGTDQFGMAPRLANEIRQRFQYSQANFIYHDRSEIEFMDSRFKVFPFGNSLDSLLQHSDIVITSASTSSFEVMARGIPTGIIRIIGNQDQNFETLTNSGLASRIGLRSDAGIWDFFTQELSLLIEDDDYRRSLSHASLEVFDFDGAARILNRIAQIKK